MGMNSSGETEPCSGCSQRKQCLRATDDASKNLDLRLIADLELAISKCFTKIPLQSYLATAHNIELFTEKFEARAPRILGTVHGRVCIFEQGLDAVAIIREHDDADAAADIVIIAPRRERLADTPVSSRVAVNRM